LRPERRGKLSPANLEMDAGNQKPNYYNRMTQLQKEKKQLSARYYNAKARLIKAMSDPNPDQEKIADLKALFDSHAVPFSKINISSRVRLNPLLINSRKVAIVNELETPMVANFTVNFD